MIAFKFERTEQRLSPEFVVLRDRHNAIAVAIVHPNKINPQKALEACS